MALLSGCEAKIRKRYAAKATLLYFIAVKLKSSSQLIVKE
jgi:hypothetical protein